MCVILKSTGAWDSSKFLVSGCALRHSLFFSHCTILKIDSVESLHCWMRKAHSIACSIWLGRFWANRSRLQRLFVIIQVNFLQWCLTDSCHSSSTDRICRFFGILFNGHLCWKHLVIILLPHSVPCTLTCLYQWRLPHCIVLALANYRARCNIWWVLLVANGMSMI